MISQNPARPYTTLVRNIVPVTLPTDEPLGIGDYLNAARIKPKADQILLNRKLISARQWVEKRTGRVLVQQTLDQIIDQPPLWDQAIELRRPPIRKVVSATVRTIYGDDVVVDPAVYSLSIVNDPYVRVMLSYAQIWPLPYRNFESLRFRTINGYLTPVTGINTTDGTLTAAGHLYSNGDQVKLSIRSVDTSAPAFPTNFLDIAVYYAVNSVSGVSLKLALTPNGSAIIPADPGNGNLFLGELPAGIREAILIMAASELFEAELSEEDESDKPTIEIPGRVRMLLQSYQRIRL